ncbi:MAG: hypothetical protein U0359_08315 [Byssovorax sp.]
MPVDGEPGDLLAFEIAQGRRAFVRRDDLARRGWSRACRGPGSGHFHLRIEVYDHAPTAEERRSFRARRAAERQALSARPGHAFLIVPGEEGRADRAVRCSIRRPPPGRAGAGTSRFDVELRLPFRADRQAPVVCVLDLVARGLARLHHRRSVFLVCAEEPSPALLAQLAEERRATGLDAVVREDALDLCGTPRTLAIQTGEAAIAELGLTAPCTVEEVRRAFRKRVAAERAHPDQGGSDEEFRELLRVQKLAMGHLERWSLPARSAA